MQQPEHIRDLITRFFEKKLDDHELILFKVWLEEDQANRLYFDKVNETYQTHNVLKQFTPARLDQAWSALSHKINSERESKVKSLVASWHSNISWWSVAATVSVFLVVTFLIWKNGAPPITKTEKIVVNNSENRNTFILLPDSTMVWLNANSTIEYSADFGVSNRKLKLTGEAFFDVRKKQKMDFVLTTDELVVQVKGTRFNVRAFQGQETKTTLEEGKVDLILTKSKKTYSMQPGDQVTVNKIEGKVEFRKVNPSNFTAWKEDELLFDNTPLADIVQKLENKYEVQIEISDEIANREHLSMSIHHESIGEVLEMIRLSSSLKYKKENNKITIYE